MQTRPTIIAFVLCVGIVLAFAAGIYTALMGRGPDLLMLARALALMGIPALAAVLMCRRRRSPAILDRIASQRCIYCGYDLRGSQSARDCPECGRHIERS
ncbi:MAG: hypothetical protein H6816_01010 [Phycisphaerales bacterium]|nr:hypothetical protein [Phycisphaerales bacterium]